MILLRNPKPQDNLTRHVNKCNVMESVVKEEERMSLLWLLAVEPRERLQAKEISVRAETARVVKQ